MTHSQYLLPGLPDLLKSHRLSYKKFLHNGIDEEFDLLSAKTELNEEEIFYEGLKLNHIDELSPSQVESLDYIYHAEEKIFLVPQRTLEDSLRGRQSHSFHLFIPLEVKILPFQDELDTSHFVGANPLKASENTKDTQESMKSTLTNVGLRADNSQGSWAGFASEDNQNSTPDSVLSTGLTEPQVPGFGSPLKLSQNGEENSRQTTSERIDESEPPFLPGSSPHVFFRGGSGSPLSETRKEFFQTALSFFFQQPKIQKIFITKRFLLLRWFCEKLQYIEPSLKSDPPEKVVQFPNPVVVLSGQAPSQDQFDFTFSKFDLETRTKLYQLYQNILLKFERKTRKNLFKSSENLKRVKSSANSGSGGSVKPGSKNHIKVFQKTSRWHELIKQIRVLIEEKGLFQSKLIHRTNKEFKLNTLLGEMYPPFPHLSVQTYQALFDFKKSKSGFNFLAFNKKAPTGVADHSHMQLSGFHFKTSGLTAGRDTVREHVSGNPQSLAINSSGSYSPVLRLGTIENPKGKSKEIFSRRSLRSNRLSQQVTFIQRVVQAKQIKNKKKKLQEIFLTTFPPIPEKKGLRFWKLQNTRPLDRATLSPRPKSCDTPAGEQRPEASSDSVVNPMTDGPRGTAMSSFAPVGKSRFPSQKSRVKSKFLKHYKAPFHPKTKWERPFHSLPPRELKMILKPVSLTAQLSPVKNDITREDRDTDKPQLAEASSSQKISESERISFKFLSLPQTETGSLWKILPKESVAENHDKDSQSLVGIRSVSRVRFSHLGFQSYQLQKLAYRQRNMFLLHSENFVKPVQNETERPSRGKPSQISRPSGKQKQAKSLVAPKLKKASGMPSGMPSGKRNSLVEEKQQEVLENTKRSPLSALRKGKAVVSQPAAKTKGREQKLQNNSVPLKKILQKKFNFDRFFLSFKERQALHLKKSLKLREKVAWRIEKKSGKLRLLPGLKFWEKAHSEKSVEEYWESLLQPYRKKIPSKLLVSIPSGDVIFVKSEKDSRPKEVKTSRNLEILSLPEGMKISRSQVSRRVPSPESSVLKTSSGQPSSWSRTRKACLGRMEISTRNSITRTGLKVSFGSKNQMRWVLEFMNMKFFMKKILTYSPAMLEFYWKHRFCFLWTALSEQGNPGVLDKAYVERKNLPKVCSDLRQLLSIFNEVRVREKTEPQKFFVSGQVGKKEWPFQKDGSKSYFALLNLGKMPFMTKQGHFLINGSGRVLVSQIAKCPNFYTKMKIDSRGRPRYWTEFVSSFKNAGEWIQFHIDLENKMFFSLGTKRKYSIFIFLGALGISPSEIPDVIEHWDFLKQSIHKEEIPIDQNENFLTYLVEPLEVREARILFHDTQNYSFFPGGEKTDEELQKFFEDIFYNPSRYFLGHAGREALNQRRRFSGTPSRSRALEKEDFLAAINALIEVRLGLAPPDDIDHLKFRRVRLPGELLQNEFHLALDEIFTLDFTKFREGPLPGDALEAQPKEQRRTIFPTLYDLEQKIFEKGRPFAISKTVGIQSTYQVSPLEKRMRNFFHTGQLSQYMDQTNPLAEITHKRRLTSLGPDGLPKQVGVAVRELHPSHFGRICPIETPEGLNAGLVASLSSQAKIGSHHTLLAPYYWVKDRTREFPQKIFNNEILARSEPQQLNAAQTIQSSGGSKEQLTSQNFLSSQVPLEVMKYPPVLPEVVFLSASAEDSVYICSEDYWFSSKYKNFETIAEFSRGLDQISKGVVKKPSSLSAGDFDLEESMQLAPTGLADVLSYSQVDSKNSLVKFQTVFPARYQQEFFTVTKSQIDFFAICPTQMISVGTSLIPFLEHDDANRALMGSNMQRQALPLLVLERPLVGTGSEKGVAQSSNSVLLSEFSGQVSFVDGRKIVVDSFPKKITSFPETLKTKNSRLLLGSSEVAFSPTSGRSGAGGDPQEVLDFSRRNLFQKFQNRTEDGNVKTISRIFTVKIKIQTRLDPQSKLFTSTKVFPISDEEYEKSRNLLRREFLKKYKEIQRKKVFPLGFWPGERWKKTGDIWKQKTLSSQQERSSPEQNRSEALRSESAEPASRTREACLDQVSRVGGKTVSFKNPVNFVLAGKKESKRNLQRPSEKEQNGRFMKGPLGAAPLFEELKRIRYKKAHLAIGALKKRIRRRREGGENSRLNSTTLTPSGSLADEILKGPSDTLLWDETGSISSRGRNFFEKANSTVSNYILKKKTLRRSILPVKAGRLFFEPTPQMIFKNILSKNAKKREILRKAFLQKAFLPQRFEPTQSEANSQKGHHLIVGSSGALETRMPESLPIKKRSVRPSSLSRSQVSWSVSMKKVTPYTQVTYNIHGYWRTNQNTLRRQRPAVQAGDWVASGDLLADSSATLRGELCVGQNILVGYVPWEGYNFEDAIVVNERLVEEDIYTSILIDRYEMEAAIDAGEKITRKIPDIKPHLLKNLDLRGIICVGTWVEEDDILVGKILPVTTELQGYSKLLADIYQIAPPVAKDISFRVPDRVSGRVLECSVSEMVVRTPDNQSFATPWKVTLYLVEKRRMKLGDKMSGRHGNKGIVSIILPPQDMPFLPDGTPLDVALNPLGVPSRMNVGQLLESLLGLAGKHLHQKYRIPAFDEMYGEDFSRRIVYDKLLEASQKTQKPWLFNPNFPGKMMLRDGRTGEYFHQPILVGYPYMLKLIHMVDDKMHARATGPYTMVTQQPLKGRANRGGQRIGEMEVWAVEAFAASYALQELLTLKSDDISGRNHFLMSFLKRKKRTVGGIPDAFRVLMHELQSLCFHVHYTEDYRLTYPTLLESSQIPETPVPGNYGRGS